ncbi:NAD(P)/FAD-dependent oxidoreductase [Halomontanus rarus]|uniref:NAD(P)/FAD-dependent oxidoreductase n=1 Tax=Halomontanus rarus TaxID=3034020 RepID=UPI0023E7C6E2|nr:NAD(P)/FAD-dependent oxidoreductase [Halovivax sp. TS33]
MTELEHPTYEVVVVGGGPAGLTTALYTTRLGHRTAVFEKEGGRHAAVTHVHNLLGVSEDVSGAQLAEHGVRQLESYGADFYPDAVDSVRRVGGGGESENAETEDGDGAGVETENENGSENENENENEGRFRLKAAHATVLADRVVFATGFADRGPEVPGLQQFTGRGLHYCLHCDAYTLGDGSVFVLGHDESAAHVAMTMCNFTDDVDLLLDGHDPEWDAETDAQVRAHPVDRIELAVVSTYPDDESGRDSGRAGREDEPWLGGFEFADGTERDYLGGFAMYGMEYNTGLATDIGCECTDEGALEVDDDFETSVDGVYAVGDVTHGQNQTTIAIGDGAKAGLAIHEELRRYPRSLEDLAADGALDSASVDAEGADSAVDADPGELDVPGSADDLRARMRRVRQLETHPGFREPRPGE